MWDIFRLKTSIVSQGHPVFSRKLKLLIMYSYHFKWYHNKTSISHCLSGSIYLNVYFPGYVLFYPRLSLYLALMACSVCFPLFIYSFIAMSELQNYLFTSTMDYEMLWVATLYHIYTKYHGHTPVTQIATLIQRILLTHCCRFVTNSKLLAQLTCRYIC